MDVRRHRARERTTWIAKLGVDGSDLIIAHGLASRYGNPEEALCAAERDDEPDEAEAPPERDELTSRRLGVLRGMLRLLPEIDRRLLAARDEGATQSQLAAAHGMTQPSVSGRLSRVHRWVEECLDRRMLLLDVDEPAHWAVLPEQLGAWRALAWRHVVLGHATTTSFGAAAGVDQGRAHRAFRAALDDVEAEGSPAVREAVGWIRDHVSLWTRPRERRGLRLRDDRETPTADAGTPPVVSTDPIDQIIAEMDACLPARKTDRHTRPCGTGVDLSRRDVLVEIERLYGRFGSRWAARAGVDRDDALAQIYRDVEVRNQGTCPYDPAKGAWSTYVVRIIRQSVGRLATREARHVVVSIDAEPEEGRALLETRLAVDPGHTEQEHEDALARVRDAVARHAGAEGLRYVQVKLEGGRVTREIPPSVRNRVSSRRAAILAELRGD